VYSSWSEPTTTRYTPAHADKYTVTDVRTHTHTHTHTHTRTHLHYAHRACARGRSSFDLGNVSEIHKTNFMFCLGCFSLSCMHTRMCVSTLPMWTRWPAFACRAMRRTARSRNFPRSCSRWSTTRFHTSCTTACSFSSFCSA